MARYVDGFVIPVAKRNLKAYLQLARKASKIWMDLGALEYRECVADDLYPKGMVYNFLKAARCKPGETVVFPWIAYKSRAHRDSVNARVMKDPRIARMMKAGEPPFDYKRMAYGGFTVKVTG